MATQNEKRYGICSHCQQVARVQVSLQKSALGFTDQDISDMEQVSGRLFGFLERRQNYVMSEHDAFGKPCSGAGSTPEMVMKTMVERVKKMSDDFLKTTLSCLWETITKGTISRDDPYSGMNPSEGTIEDWELILASECETRGISLSSIEVSC
jgi:hypothetical protein